MGRVFFVSDLTISARTCGGCVDGDEVPQIGSQLDR